MCCSYPYNVALKFLCGVSFLGFLSPFLMPREVERGAHLGSARGRQGEREKEVAFRCRDDGGRWARGKETITSQLNS